MNKLVDLAIVPIRRALRQEIGRLIERDPQIRWAIARCARSVTKDYLGELAQAADQAAEIDREQNLRNLEAFDAQTRKDTPS